MPPLKPTLNIHDVFAAGTSNLDTKALGIPMDERIAIVHRVGTGYTGIIPYIEFKKPAANASHSNWRAKEMYEDGLRQERQWFESNVANSSITEVWFNDFVANGHYNEAALMVLMLAATEDKNINCHLNTKKVAKVFDAAIDSVETTKDLGYRLAYALGNLPGCRRLLTKDRLAKLPELMSNKTFSAQLGWARDISLSLPENTRNGWFKMVENQIAQDTGLSDGTFASIDKDTFSCLLETFVEDNKIYGNAEFARGTLVKSPVAQIGFNIFERFVDIIQQDGSQEAFLFYQEMVEEARKNPEVIPYFEPKVDRPAPKKARAARPERKAG